MDLRERLNLDQLPVPVEEIAEHLGITVRREPLGGQMSGVLFRSKSGGETVIGVNESHSPTRQRFTIAHELGHAQLHRDTLYLDGFVPRDGQSSLAVNRHEIEANAFAAELLMPREAVITEFNDQLQQRPETDPGKLVRQLARLFDVSEQAMEFRLLNLGVATSV